MVDVYNKVCGDFREFYGGGLIPRDELAFILKRLNIDASILDLVPSAEGAPNNEIRFEDFVAWIVGKSTLQQLPAASAEPSPRETIPTNTNFDLVVLGGGPCGLKAAEDAAARGKSVALLEPADILTGAPTGAHSKCLRIAALRGAKTWAEVEDILRMTVASAQHQSARTLRTFKVTVLKARGAIVDENTIQVSFPGRNEDLQLHTEAIIVATGSKSNRFPPTNFNLPGVYDSDTIRQLDRIPKRMVIQGAGIISVEYALIFAKLGAHVIVIDAFPAFLPMLDSSLQEAVKQTLQDNKVEVIMGTPFKRVMAEPCSTLQNPALRIDAGGRTFGCDVLLSACGRCANSDDLGLENLIDKGLKINPRGKLIEVDENGYTGAGKVYAVGDVATGSMGLATMGQNQAARAVRALFSGLKISKSAPVKPSAIWTIPELAWAGMTEEQAKAQDLNYGVSKVDFKNTVKGCITNEDGFLKLVFDRDTGKTLGVHLFGENSCEMVNYGAEAVNLGTTIFTMLRFVFPAVTYHTLYSRAAAEAKLRLHGAKDLHSATMWKQVYGMVEKSLEASKSNLKVSEALKKAFKYYDKRKHGFLCAKDLEAALVSLGMELDEDDAAEMIYEATDGKSMEEMDYESFAAVLAQNDTTLRKKLQQENEDADGTEPVPTPASTRGRSTVLFAQTLQSHAKAGDYDAVVLGAGPAGLKAASEIGARGKRVVLIDPKDAVHGAPTGAHSKCLRESVLEGARTWAEVKNVMSRAMENAECDAARLSRTFQVKILQGYGSLVDEKTVLFKDLEGAEKVLKTEAIVIATGSKANRFPPVDYSLPGVYDSDTISGIDFIPNRMVVQGAGIVSVEYALIFAKLGTEVTMVDAFSAWLPMCDVSLQETIREELDANGIEVLFSRPFKSVINAPDSTPDMPQLLIDIGGRVLECDTLLSACGRTGNSHGLNLEALADKGLKINPRGKLIEVDDTGYTGCAKIYAVGDCATGSMGLATMGQQQAVLAARALFSTSGKMETEKVVLHKPCAVWTIPEVAWVGLTEDQVKKKGVDYSIAKVDFTQSIKGCIMREDGYLKLIFERTSGNVLGVHLFGESSCELVNYGAELVNEGITVFQVLHFVFPAVTYHQLYHQAAAEAKLRFKGARDLEGATEWLRLQNQLSARLKDSGKSVNDELVAAFSKFDRDNSGFLTQAKLQAAVVSLGLNTSEESVKAMVLEATGDMDSNEVDYQTLVNMVSAKEVSVRRASKPMARVRAPSKI
mmetsp:Transcript_31544/g.90461  ORF Transcript_31544/g.90461 Transcript_31544/m.90461 type:complete len:1252 (+) Transcript_31544:132-3887(+)